MQYCVGGSTAEFDEEMTATDGSISVRTQRSTGRQGAGAEGATLSGGHLVAKAVKAEGVDVIFTLCGGNPEAYAPGTMNQTMYK